MTLAEVHRSTLRDIEVKDGNCYLNRNKDWPIPLSHNWTPTDLYTLIPAYAQEYDVNVVADHHVKTIVDRYIENLANGNGKAKKKNVDEEEPKSQAELLMDLSAENIQQLFKDQYGFAYAVIRIADHNEVLPVENSRFKRYLAKLFWDKYQKVVGSESITNATTILQARAEYESEAFPLNLRVAWYLNTIYYDLTDDAWRAVRIDRLGWRLETETPLLFTRYKGAVAQVEPVQDFGDTTLDDFLRLTNITDPNYKLLVKVYIVSLFIPDIPHVILNLYGDKGSAKSMLYTLIKSLVDPSKPALLTLHKDRNEFIQQLSHNWVAFYDNAKHVPEWLSDEACRGATGGGHTKRRLYSDDEDFIYDFKRCLGFNGINISLTEEDALDRSIMIDLVRIPNDKRRLETDILASFEGIKAKLLGYIFHILSNAIEIHSTIQLSDKPRMADFAQWGEAIARAMGYTDLEFLRAYYDNIGKQNLEAIDAHPLGNAIAKWVESWGKDEKGAQVEQWEGTPQELLDQLEIIATAEKIDVTHRSWPKAPNILSRRLNQIRSNLLEGLGIEVSITRKTTKERANTASVKVRKIPPVSPIPPAEEQGTLDVTGDTGHTGDTIRTKGEEAP